MTLMTDATKPEPINSLWDDAVADRLSEPELLLYRSNLLGSDMRITNFGGGNTSAKIIMTNHLSGEQVEALWIKGSGGDLGSIKLDGFLTLYMDKLRSLKNRFRGAWHWKMKWWLSCHIAPFNLEPARSQHRYAIACLY